MGLVLALGLGCAGTEGGSGHDERAQRGLGGQPRGGGEADATAAAAPKADVVNELKHTLTDGKADMALRMEAARSLTGFGPAAEEAFIGVLENGQTPLQLRLTALRALAAGSGGGAVAALGRLIDSDDPIVRLEAVRGLGSLAARGHAAAVGSLRRALQHGDAEARDAAALALGGAGARAGEALPEFRAAVFGGTASASVWAGLQKMGPTAVPLLVTAAQSGPLRRAPAIRTLRDIRHGAKAAVPPLRVLASSGDPETRSLAESALRDIGPTLPELMDRLRDPDPDLRSRTLAGMHLAVWALRAEAAELVPALRVALKDPVASVRGEVPGVLADIGSPAADALPDIARLLADDNAWVRSTAALALGNMAFNVQRASLTGAARAALQRSRGDPDESVRRCVEQSLRQIATLPGGMEGQ